MKYRVYKQGLCLTLLMIMVLISFGLAHAQAGVEVGVFEDYEVLPDARLEMPVEIRNVEGLYAVDIEITFDPEVLVFEDANPDLAGLQPALGMFLDAGLTLFNVVDIETGTVRFAMTQVNPSEAKSGEGVILVLYFRGLAEGESDLRVTLVELSDRAGAAIPVEGVDATVIVTSGAAVREATAVPVQDPDLMIPIPTLEPTPVPTATTEPAQAPATDADLTDSEGKAQDSTTSEATHEGAMDEAQGFSLLRYWWIVAVVVLAAIGTGIYLFMSKKSRYTF